MDRDHRKFIGDLGLGKRRQTRVDNVLILLVESGMFYFVVQVSFRYSHPHIGCVDVKIDLPCSNGSY